MQIISFKIIDINEDNIESEGLFCKKSKKKEDGYQNKFNWIIERFKENLKYKLLLVKEPKGFNSRGFIEYVPGEYNWRSIDAKGWMVIHCLWVIGKHKKQGYGLKLLEECIKDAIELGMNGVVGMSAEKSDGLPNKTFFLKYGFTKVDKIKPSFELYAKPFSDGVSMPKFFPLSTEKVKKYKDGITIIDGHQCPYLQNMIDSIGEFAEINGIPFQVKVLKNAQEAQQNGVNAYGIYSIIYNGKVVSQTFPRRMPEVTDKIN